MVTTLKPNEMNSFINAVSISVPDILNTYKKDFGESTQNGKYMAVWDARFDALKEKAIAKNGFSYVMIRRSGLWEFVGVINIETKDLFLFFAEKRYKALVKSKDYDSHYLNSFVSFNHTQDSEGFHNVVLFDDDEYEKRRIEDAKKMLGDKFDMVERVVPITLTFEGSEIVGACAHFLNGYSEEIGVQDLSDGMNGNYNGNADLSTLPEKPIVGLKNGVVKKAERIISPKEESEDKVEDPEE